MITNIVISGATGFLGNYLVNKLSVNDNLRIIALGRNSFKLNALENLVDSTKKFNIGDDLNWINKIEGKIIFLDLAYLSSGNLLLNKINLKKHFKQIKKFSKNSKFNYIYTSSIAVYGDQMNIENYSKVRHGNPSFRTYEYFKYLSEKYTKNISNGIIWRLGHIVGPGSNYMKGLISNRYSCPLPPRHVTDICLASSVYSELSSLIHDNNDFRNITFTEVNNLMDSNSWVKLLEQKFGIIFSSDQKKATISKNKALYPLYLECMVYLSIFIPNKLLSKINNYAFIAFKNKEKITTPSFSNHSNIIMSEYKINKDEFDKSIEECKEWFSKALKV